MTQLPKPRRTLKHLHRLDELVAQQGTLLACINTLMGAVMAIDPQVAAEIATLKQAVIDDQKSDQAVVDTLDSIIADLRAGQSPADTIAALEDVKAQIAPVTSPNAGGTGTGTPPTPTP